MIEITKINRSKIRRGRGIAAGQGKTAGRGTKGQNARSGHKRYRGFGSGSMPFAQRLPKFAGIKSPHRHVTVTTAQIEAVIAAGETINRAWLVEHQLVALAIKPGDTVKIVLKGPQKDSYTLGADVQASKTVKTA